MRNLLFTALQNIGNFILQSIEIGGEVVLEIIESIIGLSMVIVQYIFKTLLKLIDSQRLDHTSTLVDQTEIYQELDVLINVNKIKQDALDREDWTPAHTMAINTLSNVLYNNCNWEIEAIHEYMKNIVESIPGLTYVLDDEEED